ncbi:MAG: N-formylglutamate amidohydrolase [Hyphomicrobiales bacterium]|nr:N-formylglutamate amidohydrolase [Hyphomicrobiales bacterium]
MPMDARKMNPDYKVGPARPECSKSPKGLQAETQLLGPADPQPFEVENADSTSPLLLVCEHAGRVIPQALGNLGLSARAYDEHIAWDIGAAEVSRGIAKRVGAPLVLQPYCRLVIDCNRPPDEPDAITAVSDRHPVPGNVQLSDGDRANRAREIFWPFQRQIDSMFARSPRSLAVSIHSFTPVMDGVARPWDIGLLHRKDSETAPCLKDLLAHRRPDLNIAFNEPYGIDNATDWFVPRHAEARGIRHVMIEIRNDLIATAAAADNWAQFLSDCVTDLLTKEPQCL